MEVTYELTVGDFYDALKAWRRRNIRAPWAGPFMTAALILSVSLLLFHGVPFKVLITFLIACIFFLTVSIIAPLWRRSAVRKHFQGNPSAKGLITLATSEDGIHVRSRHADSTAAWSSFVMWGGFLPL